MDPSIAITALSNFVGSPHFNDTLRELTKRVANAKAQRVRSEAAAPNADLADQRRALMSHLCQLQGEAMLTVSDQPLLTRLVPLLLAQAATIYEADTEQEIETIRLSLKRVGGAIEQYKQRMAHRARVRTWAVCVSMLSLWALGIVALAGGRFGWSETTMIPIFSIPLPVLLWSAVGSFAAMLYRFNASGDIELQDPLRWMFTRPLTGIVIGTVTFLIIKAGLMTTGGGSATDLGKNELVWLVAFLAGFSDRFGDTLLQSLVGRFGGGQSGPLVNTESIGGASTWASLGTWFDQLGKPAEANPQPSPGQYGESRAEVPPTATRAGAPGDVAQEQLDDGLHDRPLPVAVDQHSDPAETKR